MEMEHMFKAVRALLDSEVTEVYSAKCKIEHYHENEFEVIFDTEDNFYPFNNLIIRVDRLDYDTPEHSNFSVQVHDDIYYEFTAYDYTIGEFWKALLWRSN